MVWYFVACSKPTPEATVSPSTDTLSGPAASGIKFTTRNAACCTAGSVTPLPVSQPDKASTTSASHASSTRRGHIFVRVTGRWSSNDDAKEGSEILGDDSLERGARPGNVDGVLVARGKHEPCQLENRGGGSG